MRGTTRALTLALTFAAAAATNVAEGSRSCAAPQPTEVVPSLLQASKEKSSFVASQEAQKAFLLAKQSNHAQTGVNNWVGKFDMLEKVPVSSETTALAEVDVGLATLNLERPSGELLSRDGLGMKFFGAFPGVDMVVTPLDKYTPHEGHPSGSKHGYGVISMQGGTSTTFKFQFVKSGTSEPVAVKKLYFTMDNLDKQRSLRQEVSMLTSFNNVFLDPHSSIQWHRRNGTEPSSFIAQAPEQAHQAGSLKEERSSSLTWAFVSTSEIVMKLATPGGRSVDGRNFYFSGLSSLTKKTCMKTAESTDLKLDNVMYSNLGGEGPSIGAQRAIRYGKVAEVDGKEVDLIVRNTAGIYTPADPESNGMYNGFGMISVSPGVDANFSFSFVEHGGTKAVFMKDLMLTFHDFDRASEDGTSTSLNVRGFKRAYLSSNTKFEMDNLGGSWYGFNHKISDLKFERHSMPYSPLRLTEEEQARSVAVEFPVANVVNMGIQMDRSREGYFRNLYFSGVSRLSVARETPFVCF
mmetsp:Transcript_36230/g.84994  ORF Transcript_36230/g.84994 Transcript_36230/m.84994 type:complete len:521 (-) Transcript_36230:130-1692(-)